MTPRGLHRFSRPSLRPGAAEMRAVRAAISSGLVSNGAWVRRLEQHFMDTFGVRHAIATSSCTQALVIAVRAAGLAGARLALPAFTWPSTLYALQLNHCTPVFADIDPRSWLIDLGSVRGGYDAVVAVDTFGNAASVKARVPVLYDAAHGYGLPRLGRRGVAEAVSLSATKLPTAGEGGMILTNDAAVADAAVELRRLSARMLEVAAILAAGSIARYDALHLTQLQVIERYRKLLRVEYVEQAVPRATTHSLYTILLPSQAIRDRVRAALADAGFETRIYYAPLVRKLPVTEAVYARALALPAYPQILGRVRRICAIVDRAATRGAR